MSTKKSQDFDSLKKVFVSKIDLIVKKPKAIE